LQIRKVTSTDIAAIVPLVCAYRDHEAIAGRDPQQIAYQLERLLTDPVLGDAWMVAEDGIAIGYLLAVYVFSLEHLGLIAEIDEFFVLPRNRGSGAGARLLLAAEAEFARRGCTNVSLQLAKGNDAARRFYHRHGYAERSQYELLDKML